MRSLFSIGLSIFLQLFFMTPARATIPSISVGQPQLEGNGCPIGTAGAVVLEDGSTVSIILDEFLIMGKKGVNSWDQMKRFCRFRIPVYVPPGFNLEATSINYRGFADLPGMARAFIMTTGPVANAMNLSVGEQPIRSELRDMSGNFRLTQPLPQNFRTNCKVVTMIEFNTVLQLFGQAPRTPLFLKADAQVTIDSADIGGTDAPIRIQFRMRPCH
jgi:hypothetical protein